jgi:molybdopterin/thiamine biosynthesis adenylyltransferase
VKTAVVLGVGGLGCPAALALCEEAEAHALPLRLVLVDPDVVERSNLARQILFTERDVGAAKVEAAARRLERFPVELRPVRARFDARNAPQLLAGADLVLDGTDSFETRFAANDASCALALPLVHGAVLGWNGQEMVVVPREGSCLRCLFEGPPPQGALPTCAEGGVVSPICGVVGAAMADDASRLLRGQRPAAPATLRQWDGLRGTTRSVRVPRDPACASCGAPRAAIGHP